MTIRETILETSINDQVGEAIQHTHDANYHRLEVLRDGTLRWREDVDQATRTIDEDADRFAPIPTLTIEGNGSIPCNCDWCAEDAIEEPEADTLSAMADKMAGALAEIPDGYFEDEDAIAA